MKVLISITMFAAGALAFAQTQPGVEAAAVPLPGTVHRLARPEFDQGVAPDALAMDRMLLTAATHAATAGRLG